jgi:hypothetical protein
MNPDNAANFVQAWLREDDHVSAAGIVDKVLDRVDSLPQRRTRWLPAGLPRMSPAVGLAVATATVAVLAIVTINLLWPGGPIGGPPTPGTATPSAAESSSPAPSAQSDAIVGLPPEGTAPSDTEPGELVLQWDGSITASGMLWVYADGRMIWWRLASERAVDGDAFIGLVEQRLSPQGVEFLLSTVISTGLFDSDLVLAREGSAPYLQIQVKNGDQFVGVTWAWRGISGDAPVATSAQASELTALDALLTDPDSWPASSWDDQTKRAYVPSEYAICFRAFMQPGRKAPTEPIEAARIWALLPDAAETLILAGDPAPADAPDPNGNCPRVTTGDARAIAESTQSSGVLRSHDPGLLGGTSVRAPSTGYWLRFLLYPQGDPADEVWIDFAPVLPHRETTWLGPG